jgi:TP901 family phage tail tape measure protein
VSSKVRTQSWKVVFDADTGKFVTQLDKAQRSVSDKIGAMGQSMQRVGKSMTRNLTLPIVGFLGASAKMAMDFDNSLTKISSLVGIAKEDVASMRPEVIKMASQFGKSGTEAADALFFITSAGLRGKDAMDVLAASLKASAIGLGETKTVADLATSALNAYGSETLSATAATDVLVASVREGKLEASSLSGAMGRVLPLASAMGVQFHEVGAAFAALSRTGTDANEAATQLRGIMAALLKPTAKSEKALKNMGLSSESLRKQLKEKGLLSTLQTLKKEFGGNSAAAAEVFGNIRALSGVLDLMGSNSATTVAIFESLAAAVGDTDKAFEVTEGSAGFKYQQAMQSFKNEMINFGDTIAPEIATVTDAFKGLSEMLGSMSPATRRVASVFALIVAALGPVLWIVGKVTLAVQTMLKLFKKFPALGKVLGKLLPGMSAITAIEVVDKVSGAGKPEIAEKREANAATQRGTIPTNESVILKQIEDLRLRNPEAAARFEAKMRAAGKLRAIGGTVSAGSSYLVGERGPELLTPTSNAWITPNNRLGGGSTPINVTVNVQGSVVRERDLAVSIRDQMAQMMRRRGLDPAILGV